MTPGKSYDLKSITLIFAGIALSGYGDDGAVQYEQPSAARTHKAGYDGHVVVSTTNDHRLIARVTLMETSVANRRMWEIYRLQEDAVAAGGSYPPAPYQMRDPRSGDFVRDNQGIIVEIPTPDKGQEAGSRVWGILLPNGRAPGNWGLATTTVI